MMHCTVTINFYQFVTTPLPCVCRMPAAGRLGWAREMRLQSSALYRVGAQLLHTGTHL